MLSIRQLHPPVLSVRYFGDLDEKGLRIPASAAAAEGLPPLRSAAGLLVDVTSTVLTRAQSYGIQRLGWMPSIWRLPVRS